MASQTQNDQHSSRLPSKGDRIELLRTQLGVRVRGTVYYVDHRQILVKWDNGRSQSLRPGIDLYRILP